MSKKMKVDIATLEDAAKIMGAVEQLMTWVNRTHLLEASEKDAWGDEMGRWAYLLGTRCGPASQELVTKKGH